jgi:hypothetical protein
VADRPNHILPDPQDNQRFVAGEDQIIFTYRINTFFQPAVSENKFFMSAEGRFYALFDQKIHRTLLSMMVCAEHIGKLNSEANKSNVPPRRATMYRCTSPEVLNFNTTCKKDEQNTFIHFTA